MWLSKKVRTLIIKLNPYQPFKLIGGKGIGKDSVIEKLNLRAKNAYFDRTS
jgi:hypothetical protein